MDRQLLVLALGALLVGAGCQGVTTEPETVTPARVPSATGEPTTDSDQLVEQHQQALRSQSHTTTVTLSVEYPNGTVAVRTDTFAVGSDDTYLYERRTVGPYPETVTNSSVWQNDSHEIRRENGTVTARGSSGVDDTSLSQYLQRLLGTFELRGESTTPGYRLTGTAERAQSVPLPAVLLDHRNATVELTVHDDIIRAVTVALEADRYEADETVAVEIAVTVDDVGTTEPTRPAWADDTAA